jgi:hypothetical protein
VALVAVAAVAVQAEAPTLVPATLRNVSPIGVVRGQTVTFMLSGLNIGGATQAIFSDPAITGTPAPGANQNQAKVTATVGDGARVGVHSVYLRTPLGTTGGVTFAVGGLPEVQEKEPNDAPSSCEVSPLPATFVGKLDRVGDVDHFRFEAEAGRELVFEAVSAQIRSRLAAVITLLDASGNELAEAQPSDGRSDPILGYRFTEAGQYALRIRDLENASGGDVHYRLNAGAFPHATSSFPLGFRKGEAEVTLEGFNLPGGGKVRVSGQNAGFGSTIAVRETANGPLVAPVRLAVGEEPETLEAEAPNDTPAAAQALSAPVTVNGRISTAGDADFYRFRARKGETLILEVGGRRLGSPLDSVIEVQDPSGKPVERATLRCVAETVTTLNDRDSVTAALRLVSWTDLNVNDYVYVRGEIVQVLQLPLGPDEDVRFRNIRGQRLGMLETTPVAHANGTPVYKVQVHPPGRTFPPNGMPVFRLYFRNDDGGPSYGKDSRVTFTPPADGEYVVRIADVRGEGSPRHAYRLTIRQPKPDFRLSLSPEHPGIPTGSSVPVTVSADRIDGFDGPIDVKLEGLPEGFSATTTTIEVGEVTANLLLTAAPDAKTPADPLRLRVVGTARMGEEVVRTAEPAGGRALLTVLPKPDLTVKTEQRKIVITPGSEEGLEATITRENGFGGRVPIDLKNLPFGVRVLDVGLNGVLITESETARRFRIFCEPWVKPGQRLVYCTVRTETDSAAPTEVAAEPILLEVRSLQP